LTAIAQRFASIASENDHPSAAPHGRRTDLVLGRTASEEGPPVLLPVPASSVDPAAAPVDSPAAPESEWVPPTWEEVVRNHSARVYRLAYRLTGNPHDAEDLTQDVFVRVFRSLHRFQPGTFEGWLHRITTNLFLDGARRRQKIRFDGLADGADERLPSSWPTPAEQLADADLDHDVAAALAALTPEFRAAVVLCDIEGLTYEEISDVLDIKIGTVRSRIHRGRAQLRASLGHRRPTGDRLHYLGVDAENGADPPDPYDRRAIGLEPARSA
jgi:RNA polymerase sigma factor (sigma-70 family)